MNDSMVSHCPPHRIPYWLTHKYEPLASCPAGPLIGEMSGLAPTTEYLGTEGYLDHATGSSIPVAGRSTTRISDLPPPTAATGGRTTKLIRGGGHSSDTRQDAAPPTMPGPGRFSFAGMRIFEGFHPRHTAATITKGVEGRQGSQRTVKVLVRRVGLADLVGYSRLKAHPARPGELLGVRPRLSALVVNRARAL